MRLLSFPTAIAGRLGRVGASVVVLGLPLVSAGCSAIGVLAAKGSVIMVKPHYQGFRNQSVGVMVWAGRAIANEHPIQLDLARSIDKKLQDAAKVATKDTAKDAGELKGTTFPPGKGPDAMYAFLRNNPAALDEPIVNIAPRLGVTRLIYVEVDDLSLHPESIEELFRGELSARVQVIEVTGDTAKIAFDESARAVYPEKSPAEGMPGIGNQKTYDGTIDAFAREVLKLFVTHEEGQ